MPPTLTSARRNYRLSALISRRAVREARKVRPQGTAAIAGVVAAHQIAQAQTSQTAVADMLAEQDINAIADAILDLAAFTTASADLDRMLQQIDRDAEALLGQIDAETYIDRSFDRLIDSVVTDAARAAESVATAVRPDIYHVRFVNLPCCSRCAILAGRVYRWSTGFQRHPGCDCTMIPTTVASPLRQDPDELVRTGQVTGLSKADMQALRDGADLGQVVNVRSKKAGLMEAGHALTRGGGRPTPAGIYRMANDDREQALELLKRYGYIR